MRPINDTPFYKCAQFDQFLILFLGQQREYTRRQRPARLQLINMSPVTLLKIQPGLLNDLFSPQSFTENYSQLKDYLRLIQLFSSVNDFLQLFIYFFIQVLFPRGIKIFCIFNFFALFRTRRVKLRDIMSKVVKSALRYVQVYIIF